MRNCFIKQGLALVASAAVMGGGAAFAQTGHQRASQSSEKQVSFGLQADWSDDADFGVGGRVIVNLDDFTKGLEGVGSFDYFFPGNDLTYFEVNANVIYKFDMTGDSLRPYVGAGLNIARASVNVGGLGGSNTDVGLNLLGGVLFAKKFFAEAKFEAGGGETFVLTGGIRF